MTREIKFRCWNGEELFPVAGISWREITGYGEPERNVRNDIQSIDNGKDQKSCRLHPYISFGRGDYDKELKEAEEEVKKWEEEKKKYILMQYTGLKDKNGKEIYEGDVLKISDELYEEVKWITPEVWMNDKCPVNGFVNLESIYKTKPEIVGNIYENPDLLSNKSNNDIRRKDRILFR